MRSGPVYEKTGTVGEPVEGSHYASVISHGDGRVKLHYRVSKYVKEPLPDVFLDALRAFTNQNMWDIMYLDDDRECILEAILNGTLDVAHDGSYQPEISNGICYTTVWV